MNLHNCNYMLFQNSLYKPKWLYFTVVNIRMISIPLLWSSLVYVPLVFCWRTTFLEKKRQKLITHVYSGIDHYVAGSKYIYLTKFLLSILQKGTGAKGMVHASQQLFLQVIHMELTLLSSKLFVLNTQIGLAYQECFKSLDLTF